MKVEETIYSTKKKARESSTLRSELVESSVRKTDGPWNDKTAITTSTHTHKLKQQQLIVLPLLANLQVEKTEK